MKKNVIQAMVLVLCFAGVSCYLWTRRQVSPIKNETEVLSEEIEKIDEDMPIKYWKLPGNGCYAAVMTEGQMLPEMESTLGYQEMTQLLEKQKQQDPKCYPLYLSGNSITQSQDISRYFIAYECPWNTLAMGVIMEDEPDKVVNLFETEEFYGFICQMREWYEAGYILPDAATTRVSLQDALENQEISGYLCGDHTGQKEITEISGVEGHGTEIAEIENTMKEFLKGLETGCCTQLEEEYQSFLRDLKTAGIDRVIQQNQRNQQIQD